MKKQSGFTLIELMIVVAIIGILAAIAIPTYQDFTVRAKVSEALVSVGPAKVGVSEYHSSLAVFPDTDLQAGFQTDYDTKFVSSVNWLITAPPRLQVTMKAIGNAIVVGTSNIVMIQATATSGAIDWDCDNTLTGFTVLPQFIPADCRTSAF